MAVRISFFYKSICFLFLLLLISCKSDSTKHPFFLGGIQVNEPDHREWISTLQDVGMNTVSVTVYARQGIWNSDNIWWEKEEPYVVKEIEAAKAKGMKVVLIPRITLDHYFEENAFLWHGMTMPESDSLLSNWFKWYGVFVDRWAQVAEENGVEVLAIGSEMRLLAATRPINRLPTLEAYYLAEQKQADYIADRMVFSEQIPSDDLWVRGKSATYQSLEKYLQDEVAAKVSWAKAVAFSDAPNPLIAINRRRAFILKQWQSLIAKVRQSYAGQITYAANFDNYQEVAFWDQLDFIGINAYFKLREWSSGKEESIRYEEIQESWENIFQDLQDFRNREALEQGVFFTELGYIYRENCTVTPWQGAGFSITESLGQKNLLVWSQQPYNQQERAWAVKALHQTNQKYNLLKGILYWKLTTKNYHIPYEPFVLHLKTEKPDPLQEELLEFLVPY